MAYQKNGTIANPLDPDVDLALPANLPLAAGETPRNSTGVRGELWMRKGDGKASKGEWLKRIIQEGD